MREKLVVLDGYTCAHGDLDWKLFEAFGDLTVYDRTATEQVVERIGDASIVLTNKVPVTEATLAACPSVRYIGVLATGYNVVDLDAARARGIPVCNVPAYSTDAVAQHVFALLLELVSHVAAHDRAVREGRWISSPDFCFWDMPMTELAGKTMGIIGYGQIGQAVARIAQAFGMRVLACASREREGLVPLERVLAESDVISLHCPLTASNKGLICRDTIAKMKDGVILLNTARGPLVAERDLREAVLSGKVRAAAVDVVGTEPMRADCPLLGVEGILITPHIAWAPRETRARLMGIAAENIRRFLAGQPVNDVTVRK